jgi:hypothetical protein
MCALARAVSNAWIGSLTLAVVLGHTASLSAETKSGATKRKGPETSAMPAEPSVKAQTLDFDAASAFVRDSRAKVEAVKGYTAVFTKVERIGKTVIQQTMDMKIRQQPFSVYLHNRTGEAKGREVLYVAGAFENKLLVHQPGVLGSLAGTQHLELNSPLVMAENHYPITEIGIAKILDLSTAMCQAEHKSDPKNIEFRFFEGMKHGEASWDVMEVVRKKQKPGFVFSLSRTFFESSSKLPFRVEKYGWVHNGSEAELIESYDYGDFSATDRLTDEDFNPRNPKYQFAQ